MTYDDVLTIEEAAELLQIHVPTIRSWIERGLKTIPGGEPDEIRIRRGDLDEFLQRENQGRPAEPVHAP